MSRSPLDRRAFLRGAGGAALALPLLEALRPRSSAATPEPQTVPRMATFYFGTGMNMRQFDPEGFGPDAKLSRILKPLEPHRGHFTVLSGTYLAHGGGHDGAYPFATSVERGEQQSVSPDQLAAEVHGRHTRFPSLQLSVKRGTGFGSQALATISWNRQGVPLAAENDPKVLFDRLFRPAADAERARRDDEFRQRRSVVDAVLDDARSVERRLGRDDRQQLEQYLGSIREVERDLKREIEWAGRPKPRPNLTGFGDYDRTGDFEVGRPEGNGAYDYDTYAKLMYDLIALAFQTDSTRVVSYVVRTELAGGVYPEFGVSKGYHELTHHGNDPKNLEQLALVDTIYATHWARFLERLRSVPDGDGTLLDHTLLGFSSGMGIGHSKDRLPTVLCGGSRLGVRHQTHLQLPPDTPLSSLWHTMLDRVGVPVEKPFQDSPGVVDALLA